MTTAAATLPRGRKQPIEIKCSTGSMRVGATVYPRSSPVLAIHKGVDHRSCWRITYIPTGLRIVYAKTQRHARRLVEKLLPLDWDIANENRLLLSVADRKRRNDLMDRVKEIIEDTP